MSQTDYTELQTILSRSYNPDDDGDRLVEAVKYGVYGPALSATSLAAKITHGTTTCLVSYGSIRLNFS